ncbi:MAG: hypothetical protein V4671_29525 [Armatimonadota bacterium]
MSNLLPNNGAQIPQHVVESVTESQGKIVVTTTISLDRESLEARLPFSSGTGAAARPGTDTGLLPDDHLNLQKMQQAVTDGRITMLQLAPKTFLGFVDNRQVRAHPLRIGDTLFVFVSRHNSLTAMAELIAELMRQLPSDASWNGENSTQQIEQIAHLLNASGEFSESSMRKV